MNLQDNGYYRLRATVEQVDLETWRLELLKTLDDDEWNRQEYYFSPEELSRFADMIRESLGQ